MQLGVPDEPHPNRDPLGAWQAINETPQFTRGSLLKRARLKAWLIRRKLFARLNVAAALRAMRSALAVSINQRARDPPVRKRGEWCPVPRLETPAALNQLQAGDATALIELRSAAPRMLTSKAISETEMLNSETVTIHRPHQWLCPATG